MARSLYILILCLFAKSSFTDVNNQSFVKDRAENLIDLVVDYSTYTVLLDRHATNNKPNFKDDININWYKKFDSITSFRGEVFVFESGLYWRFSQKRKYSNPRPIQDMWPRAFRRISAVFQRKDRRHEIMIFSGYYYATFNESRMVDVHLLTDLGFDESVKRIDAVLEHEGEFYFFSRTRYWIMKRGKDRVEPNPTRIKKWKIFFPYFLKGIVTDKESIYFITKQKFYKVNKKSLHLETADWLLFAPFWKNFNVNAVVTNKKNGPQELKKNCTCD